MESNFKLAAAEFGHYDSTKGSLPIINLSFRLREQTTDRKPCAGMSMHPRLPTGEHLTTWLANQRHAFSCHDMPRYAERFSPSTKPKVTKCFSTLEFVNYFPLTDIGELLSHTGIGELLSQTGIGELLSLT